MEDQIMTTERKEDVASFPEKEHQLSCLEAALTASGDSAGTPKCLHPTVLCNSYIYFTCSLFFLHLLQSLYFIFSIDVYLIVDEKGDKTDIHILEILVIAHT